MAAYVNGHSADDERVRGAAASDGPLPANPADCSDPQTALALWCAKIAKEATGAYGLTTLKDACADMAMRAPLCDPFRTAVIGTLLRCANDHLGDTYTAQAIEPIFLEAFPDLAANDAAVNAELDDAAITSERRTETAMEVARLARLSRLEYDRERKAAASAARRSRRRPGYRGERSPHRSCRNERAGPSV